MPLALRSLLACATLLLGCTQPPARAGTPDASQPPAAAVAPTAAAPLDDVAHGEYLATVCGCLECHTPRLPPDYETLDMAKAMSGGTPFQGPWGLVHSANVSAVARAYQPALLEATVRGQLSYKFQMPTELYAAMAADDMRDLIAYLRSLTPVDVPAPTNVLTRSFRPPRLQNPSAVRERAPTGATVERGAYLVQIAICKDCHSPRAPDGSYDEAHLMSGAGIAVALGDGQLLQPPNLTSDVETGLGAWSDADIIKAIRTGVARSGRTLHPAMPYAVAFSKMSDDDVKAIVAYLRTLPPQRRAIPRVETWDMGKGLTCCVEPPPAVFAVGRGPGAGR
jgi:mono/diheme cytochrome c family protein